MLDVTMSSHVSVNTREGPPVQQFRDQRQCRGLNVQGGGPDHHEGAVLLNGAGQVDLDLRIERREKLFLAVKGFGTFM